jgi:hypothetical protein
MPKSGREYLESLELYRSAWAFPAGHHTVTTDATRSRIVGQSRGADGASYGLAPEIADTA